MWPLDKRPYQKKITCGCFLKKYVIVNILCSNFLGHLGRLKEWEFWSEKGFLNINSYHFYHWKSNFLNFYDAKACQKNVKDLWEVSANSNKYFALLTTHSFTTFSKYVIECEQRWTDYVCLCLKRSLSGLRTRVFA